MTIEEIYENARRKLDKSEITIGEFAEIVGREVYDPCEDCISRQDAINAINEAFKYVFAWDGTNPLGEKVLEKVPSAQPERKKGHWTSDGNCSECGKHAPFWAMASTYYKSSFCPNCGADMRGERNEMQ